MGLSSPLSIDAAWKVARTLTARADVAYAEPDAWIYPSEVSPVTPSDPSFAQQWDLWDSTAAAGGWSTRAPAAWSRTVGRPSVVVAVLDTGLTVHPDISAEVGSPLPTDHVVRGFDFVSADDPATTGMPTAQFWTANDGDGRDADPSDPGDWITSAEGAGVVDNGFFAGCGENPDGTSDSSWHGTHVTGTIVARQGNGIGVSGIAPGVKVQPVRVLGKCGGYMSDIAAGVTWASGGHIDGVPDNPTPAKVINMSLGGTGTCETTLSSAIGAAVAAGTTVVVAAGNSGVSITPTPGNEFGTGSQPADCAGVVVVAATDRTGHVTDYSNFGTATNPITIAAPGGAGTGATTDILSTVNAGTTVPTTPTYAWYAGTSMATPHVAAAAALLQSLRAGRTPYTPAEITTLLHDDARAFPAGARPGPVDCTPDTCGAGILALDKPLPTFAPLAPVATATARNLGVGLSWTPGDDGGRPATVTVEQSEDGVVFHATSPALTGLTGTTTTITGLLNDAPNQYWFRVTATNSVGDSPSVVVGPVTPSAYIVSDLVAAGGVERFTATWTASTAPDVTGYAIRYRKTGTLAWTTTTVDGASTTSTTITSWPAFMPSGSYDVAVAALTPTITVDTAAWSDTAEASVSMLTQTRATSGSVLRPFRDGFQDAVKITATSNFPVAGTLRMLSPTGRPILVVPLATGKAWSYTWAALDARRVRVPNGVYHAQVLLAGRDGVAAQVGALLTIVVASSQAGRPVVTAAPNTFYPYPDKYLDTTTFTATAGVPATWTLKLVRSGKTVWTSSLRMRLTASVLWAGLSSARTKVPAGIYTLVVTAKGGEGIALSRSIGIAVSWKRLHSQRFTVNHLANDSAPFAKNGTLTQNADGSLYVLPAQILTFAPSIPSTVKGYVGVTVTTCTQYGGDAGAVLSLRFVGASGVVDARRWTFPNAGLSCYSTTSAEYAPAFSLFSSRLHFWLANDATDSASAYYISYFVITGYRYYLA